MPHQAVQKAVDYNAMRRSDRISMALPITVRGTEVTGQTFEENSATIAVNKYGALISCHHKMAIGSEVVILNHALSRIGKAHVKWVGEKAFLDDPYEVGVELSGGEYLWPSYAHSEEDISFQGWASRFARQYLEPGAPAPAGTARRASDLPLYKSSSPGPAAAGPVLVSASGATPGPHLEAQAAGTQRGVRVLDFPAPRTPKLNGVSGTAALSPSRASAPSTDSAVEAGLYRFAKQADEMAAERLKVLDAKLRTVAAAVEEALARFAKQAEEAATERFQGFEERLQRLSTQTAQAHLQAGKNLEENFAASIGQRIRSLGVQLQTSQEQVQALMDKFEKLLPSGQMEIERIQGSIRKSADQAVQSAIQTLASRWEKDLEATSCNYVQQVHQRIQEEASRNMEVFSREAGARLAIRQAQAMEQAKTQITQATQKGLAEFQESLRKTAEETGPPIRAEWEKSMQQRAGQLLDRLSQSVQKQAQTCLHVEEASLLRNLQEMQEQIQENITMAGVKAAQVCQRELSRSGKEAVGEAERELNAMARATLESLNGEAQSTAQKLRRLLHGTFEEIQEGAKQGLRSESELVVRRLHDRLEQATLSLNGRANPSSYAANELRMPDFSQLPEALPLDEQATLSLNGRPHPWSCPANELRMPDRSQLPEALLRE